MADANIFITPAIFNKTVVKAPKKTEIIDEKLKTSVDKYAQSMKAISAAKHHTVILDCIPSKKVVAGPVTKTIIVTKKTAEMNEQHTTEKKSVSSVVRTPYIVPETKAAKKSKIGKLLKGKKFDLS